VQAADRPHPPSVADNEHKQVPFQIVERESIVEFVS
jgi:hypothetical protein